MIIRNMNENTNNKELETSIVVVWSQLDNINFCFSLKENCDKMRFRYDQILNSNVIY